MALTILIPHAAWKTSFPEARTHIRKAVKAALAAKKLKMPELAVVLTDDAAVAPLNGTYRGKPNPTNVLSFPDGEEQGGGDILLAYETIAREAIEQNKTFADHTLHLVVHGVLHLMGYDHENDEEAEVMESEEVGILKTLNVANPYTLR